MQGVDFLQCMLVCSMQVNLPYVIIQVGTKMHAIALGGRCNCNRRADMYIHFSLTCVSLDPEKNPTCKYFPIWVALNFTACRACWNVSSPASSSKPYLEFPVKAQTLPNSKSYLLSPVRAPLKHPAVLHAGPLGLLQAARLHQGYIHQPRLPN